MLSLPQSIYRSFVSSLKFYIVDTVHPPPFELVVCWAFPAYILNKIKPCNLDLVKQFTGITYDRIRNASGKEGFGIVQYKSFA